MVHISVRPTSQVLGDPIAISMDSRRYSLDPLRIWYSSAPTTAPQTRYSARPRPIHRPPIPLRRAFSFLQASQSGLNLGFDLFVGRSVAIKTLGMENLKKHLYRLDPRTNLPYWFAVNSSLVAMVDPLLFKPP